MISKEQLDAKLGQVESDGPAELTMDQLDQIFGGSGEDTADGFHDRFVDDSKKPGGPTPPTPFQDVTWPPQ